MTDVATLIENLELLRDGLPLPGDDEKCGWHTFGDAARLEADVRITCAAISKHPNPINSRFACELVDNFDTILAALRYWNQNHD